MKKLVSELLLYSDLGENSILKNMCDIIEAHENGFEDKNVTVSRIYGQIKRLLDLATAYGFNTNLWQNYLTFVIISNAREVYGKGFKET